MTDFIPRLIAWPNVLRCPSCRQLACKVTQMTANDQWYDREMQRRVWRERPTLTLACSGCEFVVDLYWSSGRIKSSAEVLEDVREFLATSTSGVPAADTQPEERTR